MTARAADQTILCTIFACRGMMAFELAIIGVVVGIVLGQRYKILILVPAVLFAMIFAIIVGAARADSFWSIVLTTVALVVAVQLGIWPESRYTRSSPQFARRGKKTAASLTQKLHMLGSILGKRTAGRGRGLLCAFTGFGLRKLSPPIGVFADQGNERQRQEQCRDQE
jgi:hypothetical protein